DNLAATPRNEEARIELRNTIVATDAQGANCEGAVESLVEGGGHNLDYPSRPSVEGAADTCGMSAANNDQVNVDPKLDPSGLQSNGGPTETIALLSTSPAIGVVPLAGDCSVAELGPVLAGGEGEATPVDQRGMPRPGIAGRGCDVGAYEYQEAPKAKEPVTEPAKEAAKTVAHQPQSQVLGVKIVSPVCTSRRDITIHIQNVKQFGLVKAVVSVNGKARRTLTGRHLTTAINLVGLPKGTFTVSIVARTRSGSTLHGRRVYHTCHTRLPGHRRLRL
ncbi:MAG: choice-of-anchor Q domain-containing protein, partial [Solirubrobacteraceae bacterium]